jgi:hypothetical protein
MEATMLGRATRAEVAKERRDLGLAILVCCTSFERSGHVKEKSERLGRLFDWFRHRYIV